MSKLAALLAIFATAPPAAAGTILLSATAQGWMTATANNGFLPGNNYVAGNCGSGDCYTGEFRNFFRFDLPVLDSPVLAATLLLDTSSEALLQGSSLTYQVTSAPGNFTFADLGTGTRYGSRVYTAADQYQATGILLDVAALADLQAASGGAFLVGGRVSSPTAFGSAQPDQLIFGHTGAPQQLEIVTGTVPRLSRMLLGDSAAVPEPRPAVLLLAGVVLIALGRVRR